MADITLVPKIALDGILLEPLQGGVRLKVRGGSAIHLPWTTAAEVARELALLAASAARTRP